VGRLLIGVLTHLGSSILVDNILVGGFKAALVVEINRSKAKCRAENWMEV
jgi:hypothetical protein